MSFFNRELSHLLAGVKSVSLTKFSKRDVIKELVSNGVAALIAYMVYVFLRGLFKVDSNLKYGLKKTFSPKKIDAMEISEKEFSWIMDWFGTPIIFVISIVVFSIIEQVMEGYFKAREKKMN